MKKGLENFIILSFVFCFSFVFFLSGGGNHHFKTWPLTFNQAHWQQQMMKRKLEACYDFSLSSYISGLKILAVVTWLIASYVNDTVYIIIGNEDWQQASLKIINIYQHFFNRWRLSWDESGLNLAVTDFWPATQQMCLFHFQNALLTWCHAMLASRYFFLWPFYAG